MSGNQLVEQNYWDISDLSLYLKVKVKTLYSMVQDIPHYRIGKLIRFKKQEIDAWLDGKRKQQGREVRSKKTRPGCSLDIDRLIRKTIDQENS